VSGKQAPNPPLNAGVPRAGAAPMGAPPVSSWLGGNSARSANIAAVEVHIAN